MAQDIKSECSIWLSSNSEKVLDRINNNPYGFIPRTYSRQFLPQTVWRDMESGKLAPSAAAMVGAINTYLRYGNTLSPAPEIMRQSANASRLVITEGQRLCQQWHTTPRTILLQLPPPVLDKLQSLHAQSQTRYSFPTFCIGVFTDALVTMRKAGISPRVFGQGFEDLTLKPWAMEPFVLLEREVRTPYFRAMKTTGWDAASIFALLRQNGKDANAVVMRIVMWWLQMVEDHTMFFVARLGWLTNWHNGAKDLYRHLWPELR